MPATSWKILIPDTCLRRLRSVLFLLVTLALALSAAAQSPTNSWKPDLALSAPSYPFTFVGYGDIRFTDPTNHDDSDPAARKAEIARIVREKPAFVVITGDLVLSGGSARDWQVFDAETAPLRKAGIALLPALGNHDVSGKTQALENYFQRFPQLQGRRSYSVRAANLVLFVLDSTSDDSPGSEQSRWLEQGLEGLPPDVDFVLVALHHPPLTHSSDGALGGGHSPRSQEQQLAALLEKHQQQMRARIIVMAGHVHNYERYEEGGVTYIVSGGGGATPYMVPRSGADFYRDSGPTYHICNFSVEPGVLRFQMLKLTFDRGHPKWTVKDSFVSRASDFSSARSAR